MIVLDKNSIESMPCLMDEVHDRYFHFDDIVFNRDAGEWKMPLGEKRKALFKAAQLSQIFHRPVLKQLT